MTKLKLARSALGWALSFAVPISVVAYTSFEEVDVVSTEPIFQLVEQRVPAERCQIEYVPGKQPRFDKTSQTPGIIGALVGGAIGNAVGSEKSNQRVGAVAGALLGASIAKWRKICVRDWILNTRLFPTPITFFRESFLIKFSFLRLSF